MATELTHARMHPSFCMAPGLFRSHHKGTRKAAMFDISYSWNGRIMRFVGSEQLGAYDMRLLQVIVALAGSTGVILSRDLTDDVAKELRVGLEIDSGDVLDAVILSCRAGKLLKETGMTDGGANLNILKASLMRMGAVKVFSIRNGAISSYKMLRHRYVGNAGQLHIALNPLLARAAFEKPPYTRIDLDEVRRIESDAARLLHQRLCGFIDQGASTSVGIEKLCSYSWGVEPLKPLKPLNPATVRKRRQRIREALGEISRCGWTVNEYGRDKFSIRRPLGKRAVGTSSWH